jgi:hypothetical protein
MLTVLPSADLLIGKPKSGEKKKDYGEQLEETSYPVPR